MRIVLIAYHFPPDPAVGSLRAAKVARAFVEAGHHVDVVTACLPAESGTRLTDDPALSVHPVAIMPSPRDLTAWVKKSLSPGRRDRAGAGGSAQVAWVPPTHVPSWKRLLSSLVWLPDDRQGFIVPAWRKARELLRGGVDLVYSTAPPYSPHVVGLLLKRFGGVRWVLELRDPWSDNDQKPWWVRTRATDALDARLERLCLSRADLVVTVSDGIQRRLRERFPGLDPSRLLVARNGIEHLASSAHAERRPGPVRIVYAGTFYYSRDPRPFLRGLAAVCRRRRLGPDQVRVDFIGACREVGTVRVEEEIEALGLTGLVHIQDWLPHAAARGVVEEADVLLLLAQRQPDQIPNKLYEYLGSRRPILAFADAEGETARMLRQVGGHRVVTGDDDADVARALDEILLSAGGLDGGGVDETVLKEWTTDVQMQRLLAAVHA
jgi:hypothetical protein